MSRVATLYGSNVNWVGARRNAVGYGFSLVYLVTIFSMISGLCFDSVKRESCQLRGMLNSSDRPRDRRSRVILRKAYRQT